MCTEVLNPLELELQMVLSLLTGMMETKPGSSVRESIIALDCSAVSPAQPLCLFVLLSLTRAQVDLELAILQP